MKRINKLLALLLCAVMIFSTIPLQGFASETETADTAALTQPEAEPAGASENDALKVEEAGGETAPGVAKLASTGEEFKTLQAAFDAAKTALEGDSDAEKIVLLDNTTECVKLSWLRSNGSMTLTIDLNGYTVTGDGTSSVMTFSGATNTNNYLHIVIEDSSESKTGSVTGGSAATGGAIRMDNAKNGDSLTINGGNFYGNTATTSGGAIYCATLAPITINGGNFYNNTAKSGGAIYAYKVIVTGGTITGNSATGTDIFTGRGGGIALWGTSALELKVTGGQIYGNTAARYGDDIVFCSTNKTTASMALLNAVDMGVKGVDTWCIDGYYGSYSNEALLSDRYDAETNVVAFEDYASFGGKTAKGIAVALKAGSTAPAAPSWENTNVVVIFECMTNGEISSHGAASMGFTFDEKYCTVGEVYENADGKWACDVTVDLQKYYDEMVGYADEAAKRPHRLTNDVELNSRVMTAIWDEEEALWIFETVTFETTCAPENFTLTLDPNGGKVDPATVDVTVGEAVGELPVPTKTNCIFDGWYDAAGNEVTAETIYTVADDSTITAKWIQYPGKSSTNVTKELFTIQCTVNHEHGWLCNWYGSHVTLVKDSVKWNEELGRWEAQCKIGSSMLNLINLSTTKKNYFGGITHHYDVTNYTFDLYYDPNFTGLNSQSKEVTGMWLPAQEYVVPVYCYTEPAMPNISKITNKALWVRDTDPAFRNKTYSTTYTIKQLIAGTYTLSEMYTEGGKFYVDLTITDLAPYIDAMNTKNGKDYILPDWENHKSAGEFKFTLKYNGSTTDYKQDGTGWIVDDASYANNKEKLNGMSMWLTEQFTVTYTDGVEGKAFADHPITVNAYSENGGTSDDWADFAVTATPAYEAPARKGYTFAGWTPKVVETVTEDATYTATWTINTYNITVEAGENGTVEVQATANFNEVVKIAITPNAGYSVVSAKLVYVSDGIPVTTNLMNAERFRMPAADVTLIVEFVANEYTLTLDPNGGNVDPASITVTYDAAIGELPVPTKVNCIFDGWYDAAGNKVTAETIYTVADDSTITAKWIQYPGKSSTNVTKELFTIQCSVKHEHSWLCNWFGSHVTLVKDSVKWNEELGRWEAQCKIGSSMLNLINLSTTKKNYFGGITHHYDVTNYTFDLYYDPNFTGLNSQSKEVTGMWLPAQEYVVPVYCYTEPAMPNISKITNKALWVRDTDPAFRNKTYSTTYTIKQLIAGTYTLSEMYTEGGKFYVDLTITDLAPYIDAMNTKNGKDYILPDWENHKSAGEFKFTLKYNSSTTDYKQDGTGWIVDDASYANNKEKLNGMSMWLTEQFTVTYTDGVEGKAFADHPITVNAYSENGGTSDDWADFSVTATPTIEDPSFVNYIFNGWTPAVAETVTETVTYTAKWIQYPGKSSTNVTKELFTIQCTVNHEHGWLCNWFGSHVTLVKDSVKWNEELGRWEAQCKIGSSMLNLINLSTTKKNYFGGITHHYDVTNYTFDLYYDPNFTGLNSQSKEVTGMWLPAQEYVVPVYCYTEPAMPNLSKITATVIWARDTGNKLTTHSQKFTVKQLPAGSYTVGEMYNENGKFYVDVTVTDLSAIIKALGDKTGKSYVLPAWEKHYASAADFSFTLTYTGSTTDYKQDGTGWALDATDRTATEKLNGKSLWLTEQFAVTYTDGVEGKVFADQTFTVNAYTENGAAKNAVTDFTATATPAFEAPERTGYTFAGWTPEVAATVTGNVTYTAQWTANEYTLTLDANGGKVEPAALTVTYDAAIGNLPVPERAGYTFNGWFDTDGNEVTAETVYTIAGDSTVTARWTANQYTLTLDANGGKVEPAALTVTYDAAIGNLPVPARTGYTFNGWFDAEGNEVTAETVYTIAGDSTVTAKWTANQYTLILDANGGKVEPAALTVTYDAAIGNLPVPTRTGYTFNGWFDAEGNEVTAETVYTIAGDSTVTAKWTANQYTLTLDANGGMFVMPLTEDAEAVATLTITVVYDQPIGTLPAPERAGYTFNGWFDADGNEVTAETVYTIAGDSTVTAKWTANKYTITLNPNYGKVDTKSVEVTYDEAIGKLPKPTREGFFFTFWRDEAGNMITEETIYNVAGDITLYAEWRTASPADSPATGDGMTMFAMISMLVSAAALLFLMERKRRAQA